MGNCLLESARICLCMKSAFLLIVLSFCLTSTGRAWNAEGHMVIAQIAYNHLKPEVKAQCDALVATPIIYSSNFNNTFVTAAVWADDIKSYTSTFSTWHYIDIPFSLDGTSTNSFSLPAFDVVKAIRTNIYFLQNPGTTQSNRAFHLRMLLHFIGDIQQPLHCSTAIWSARTGGDAGGNTFYLTGDYSNLHSLWDSGGYELTDNLSRPLSVANQSALSNKAANIETIYPYDYTANVGKVTDPLTWAQEGVGLAQAVCYANIALNATPDTTYFDNAAATTNQRMATGGQQLADLLNTIFGTNAVTLTAVKRVGSNFSFSWPGLYGRSYQVQWKTNLSDAAWNNLTTIAPTANQTVTFTESLSQARRFYRVVQ